ncbi:MAG: hypothetical protein ACFFCS_27730 [Candidatus Hodarchaeota archaeon]
MQSVEYYTCKVCGCRKKPKKTSLIRDYDYLYKCPKCHHLSSLDGFIPDDYMKYLFV